MRSRTLPEPPPFSGHGAGHRALGAEITPGRKKLLRSFQGLIPHPGAAGTASPGPVSARLSRGSKIKRTLVSQDTQQATPFPPVQSHTGDGLQAQPPWSPCCCSRLGALGLQAVPSSLPSPCKPHHALRAPESISDGLCPRALVAGSGPWFALLWQARAFAGCETSWGHVGREDE